jgi:hypothetical protein
MPRRRFSDARGMVWDVWEVEPSRAERRGDAERRAMPRLESDRRRASDAPRLRMSSELTHGWLCFQSLAEKRRLAPVPDGWASLDDALLECLLREATPSGRARRLLE